MADSGPAPHDDDSEDDNSEDSEHPEDDDNDPEDEYDAYVYSDTDSEGEGLNWDHVMGLLLSETAPDVIAYAVRHWTMDQRLRMNARILRAERSDLPDAWASQASGGLLFVVFRLMDRRAPLAEIWRAVSGRAESPPLSGWLLDRLDELTSRAIHAEHLAWLEWVEQQPGQLEPVDVLDEALRRQRPRWQVVMWAAARCTAAELAPMFHPRSSIFLCRAARDGRVDAMQWLFDQGVRPNFRLPGLYQVAIGSNQPACVLWTIEHGGREGPQSLPIGHRVLDACLWASEYQHWALLDTLVTRHSADVPLLGLIQGLPVLKSQLRALLGPDVAGVVWWFL